MNIPLDPDDIPDQDALNRLTQAVRSLIADTDPDRQILGDDEIQNYLALNAWNYRRGAADALDAIATSEVLVGKVIRTQDLQTDGAKVADNLRRQADRLRAQADDADAAADDFAFDVVFRPGTRRPEKTNPEVWGL